MYLEDLALDDLQGLICHKTKSTFIGYLMPKISLRKTVMILFNMWFYPFLISQKLKIVMLLEFELTFSKRVVQLFSQ